ncbi:MAG: GtrA family protein [Dehalococcoidia bacterium]
MNRDGLMRPARVLLEREVVRYGIVGVSGIAVDLGLLALLYEVFGVPLLVANVLSFSGAVASNYRLNSYWTFRSRNRRSHVAGGALFLLAALVGLGISEAGLWLVSQRLGLFYIWAKLGLVVVVFAWNYVFNNAITFRHQDAAPTRG